MSRRNLLILLLALSISYACYLRNEKIPYARYAAEGLATIEQNSLETVPSRELFDGALRGMVDVLHERGDPHSQFLDEAHANPLRSEIHQQFGGIGVRIGFAGEQHRLAIVGPLEPGSPAERANLRAGDYIVAIDDQSTAAMEIGVAQRLVRGDPGTIVRLTMESPTNQEMRKVELKRSLINIESVLGDRRDKDGGWRFRLESDPSVAHVRITSFGDHTAAEFAGIMRKLTADGAQAIVLDLRDNPGGSLDAAVSVCEMLLPAEKMIVETRGRSQALIHRYATSADGPYMDVPVAVIVNHNSASAAEIVAACLQDHQRAVVVGERSYGKGTVQQLLQLESGKSLLKLTWASFWRPSGANIHRAAGAPSDAKWGVAPDIGYERKLSADEFEAYKTYRDNRDGIGPNGDAVDSKGKDAAKTASFVDEPLQLATKCLQDKLSDKP